jgi:inorganic pyrophosphatase
MKVVIEVAGGSCERTLFNEQTLEPRGTRQMPRPYPYPYGFIPGTHSEDGDCLDCFVLTSQPLAAGMQVECEAVGVLEMLEDGQPDPKVLAVLPGESAALDPALRGCLHEFIEAVFAEFPDAVVQVGEIVKKEQAISDWSIGN